MRLLDEGVDVWRPVAAVEVEADMYVILPQDRDEDEHWEFGPGTMVIVSRRASAAGPYLRAERAADHAKSVA